MTYEEIKKLNIYYSTWDPEEDGSFYEDFMNIGNELTDEQLLFCLGDENKCKNTEDEIIYNVLASMIHDKYGLDVRLVELYKDDYCEDNILYTISEDDF